MTQTYFFKPPTVGVFCYLQLNAFLVDKKHSEKVFEPSPNGAGVIQEKKIEKSTVIQLCSHWLSVPFVAKLYTFKI